MYIYRLTLSYLVTFIIVISITTPINQGYIFLITLSLRYMKNGSPLTDHYVFLINFISSNRFEPFLARCIMFLNVFITVEIYFHGNIPRIQNAAYIFINLFDFFFIIWMRFTSFVKLLGVSFLHLRDKNHLYQYF